MQNRSINPFYAARIQRIAPVVRDNEVAKPTANTTPATPDEWVSDRSGSDEPTKRLRTMTK